MTDAMQREFPALATRLHAAVRSLRVRAELLAKTGARLDFTTDPAALEVAAASDALDAYFNRARKAMAAEPRPVWAVAAAANRGGLAHAH